MLLKPERGVWLYLASPTGPAAILITAGDRLRPRGDGIVTVYPDLITYTVGPPCDLGSGCRAAMTQKHARCTAVAAQHHRSQTPLISPEPGPSCSVLLG